MGLLGVLGKIGKGVANVATGGIAGTVIDALGGALGGGAAAAKDGRMSEAQLQVLMNQQNNRAALEASTFNAGREGGLMRRALSSRMLQDRQGPTDPRDKFGGGMVSPELKALAAKYGDSADRDVTTGGYRINPTMSSIPTSGAMEKIGGIAGTAGGILGILGKLGGGGSRDVPQNMGQQSMAPNLPYQPLPREDPWLQARPLMADAQMPSGDPRLLSPQKKPTQTARAFPPVSGVRF